MRDDTREVLELMTALVKTLLHLRPMGHGVDQYKTSQRIFEALERTLNEIGVFVAQRERMSP